MQRYVLKDLSGGDRFYFVGDSKKRIFTLNDVHTFIMKKQAGYTKQYANCRPDAPDGVLQVEQHLANRYVIFLRNINNPL